MTLPGKFFRVASNEANRHHSMHLRQFNLHLFQLFFSTTHFKTRENKSVGGGIKVVKFMQLLNISFAFSSVLPFSSFLPQNSGKCNCRGWGVIFVQITTSRAPAASQITFSSFDVFLFPPQNSRKCRCGVLVVCSIHAHAQHLMHLRQSDLRVFSFYFPWHFKVRENEIVGGGIGCQIQSLQFYPSHFLPQNSGKCNCRGWGVIFVQNYNISCTCGKSNYDFHFLCRFPFPTSKLEKM